MSNYTDVLLLFNYLEDEVLEALVALDVRAEGIGGGEFRRVTEDGPHPHWGGSPRGAECHVVAGTFNHLDAEHLRETVRGLPWKCTHSVQLLLHNENDALFGMWVLLDGRWAEVPIPRTGRHHLGHLERSDCPGDEF